MPHAQPVSTTCLSDILTAQKNGLAVGVYSICSANAFVLEAAMRQAKQDGKLILVESTSNQVNQYGGYMGLTPAEFRAGVLRMAERFALPPGKLLLGGDHLGPNVWQAEPARRAMQQAEWLVADYVRAGYTKIHLDASMRLGDDPPGALDPQVSARRAALLCRAAEEAWHELPGGSPPPCYIIGTEVPPPGGAKGIESEIEVTPVARAEATIEMTRRAFLELGLGAAWERVIALVVQPGVEFGDTSIHPYRREGAAHLARFIETVPGMVYEAHSTDYQTPRALRELVEDHFAILKVGPALTFALREALFALELIERELLAKSNCNRLSQLQTVVEVEMLIDPSQWQKYYLGSAEEQSRARRYSLSDRIRYYWAKPRVQSSLDLLLSNLQEQEIPLTLISQYLPMQFRRILQGELGPEPRALIVDKITDVLRDYRYACDPD